uniref:Pyridoxal-phosphate dependent enzyme n=1 Tax=Acidobacterium capsulatum TaxID=33075 RepID=A0A7V5CTL8_9BACT
MTQAPLTDLLAAMETVTARPAPDAQSMTQWRYLQTAEPVTHPVTLGEGGTPLQTLRPSLLLKEEGLNPTGSVQDRVASILITAARAAGRMEVSLGEHSALPSSMPDSLADALAVSVATYAAQAGLRAQVVLSAAASEVDFLRVAALGASHAGPMESSEGNVAPGDLARATQMAVRALAMELAEQMRWKLPETLLAPGASPLEMLAYENAFAWLREQEWVSSPHTPRCVAIHIAPAMGGSVTGHARVAAEVLRKVSDAVGIVEEEHVRGAMEGWARQGWLLAPGAAAAVAYCEQHAPLPGSTVIVNPRAALASTGEVARLLGIRRYPGRMPVGGIITPQ